MANRTGGRCNTIEGSRKLQWEAKDGEIAESVVERRTFMPVVAGKSADSRKNTLQRHFTE
ncbi:hypothetical protein [Parabacteroides distasonis]|uniref:hypothetical protein n=1 Tax=Parabacteroides distasonis TaxID=823 RepID=UPI00189EC73B|nr:hypothetical protein [Parabacteroides distasonis]MDB9154137.1 hypothetical protein [Parabacteroides distasonis]MDB9158666.1 hypothetical protein [Parabacteroides distasonis]MDB9167442.1 hypothetical protein [Parabacteroides distasonis]MDB9171952.1 hypothetical protein [Parabacteroides distasonis]MDB9196956.1 hypothetical protein [Parabacteroides distasonis]